MMQVVWREYVDVEGTHWITNKYKNISLSWTRGFIFLSPIHFSQTNRHSAVLHPVSLDMLPSFVESRRFQTAHKCLSASDHSESSMPCPEPACE